MYTGKKPSGRAQNIDEVGSRPERPFFRGRGERGAKEKKLFHVISEEIFKIRSSTGFLEGGKGGALDSHSPPA